MKKNVKITHKTKTKKVHKSSHKSVNVVSFLERNLLYVSVYCLAFFVLISFSVSLDRISSREIKLSKSRSEEVLAAEDYYFQVVPELKPSSSFSFPFLSAQGVLIVDPDSKHPLFEKNPDSQFLPASTVKIITALVVMDFFPEDEIITVGNVAVAGQKMKLVKGEKIRAGDLLEGLLVYSSNDAAEVLAENYAGGRKAFIKAMNEKAQEIGLENTVLKNPTGIDEFGQFTSARDLVKISEYAMSIPRFSEIVQKKNIKVSSVDGKVIHALTNTNKLLGKVDGVLGVKTGWTEDARENLVTYVERDDKKILISMLGSQDRFGETKELIDWTFANYQWVLEKTDKYDATNDYSELP